MYTNNANSAEKSDLIAAGEANRVTVLDGGRARTWIEFGTLSDGWDAQLSIAGNVLTSNPAEASRSVRRWTFTLEGNGLTLEDSRSEFDFTLANRAGVSATELVTFVRRQEPPSGPGEGWWPGLTETGLPPCRRSGARTLPMTPPARALARPTEKTPGTTVGTGPAGSSLTETSSLQLFLSGP